MDNLRLELLNWRLALYSVDSSSRQADFWLHEGNIKTEEMTWVRCVVVILQHETIQKETFLQHIERKSRVTRPYEILAEGDLVSNLTFLIRDQTNSCRQNETYRLLKRRLNRFGCSDRRITPVWLIQVSGNFPTLLSYTAVQRCLCSYTEHVDIFITN